jgi:hypothetical protein
MTIAAAAAFTAWHFAAKKAGRADGAVFTSMLMFWGAALMWSVDCVAGAIEGEPLFDMSARDAVLGVIVLAAGLAVFGVLAIVQKFDAPRT